MLLLEEYGNSRNLSTTAGSSKVTETLRGGRLGGKFENSVPESSKHLIGCLFQTFPPPQKKLYTKTHPKKKKQNRQLKNSILDGEIP